MYGLTSLNKLNRIAAEAEAILQKRAAQGNPAARGALASDQKLRETIAKRRAETAAEQAAIAERKEVHVSPAYTKTLRRGEVFPN